MIKSREAEPEKARSWSVYEARMENITCMLHHINDIPDIFDVTSSKCRSFLIQCFSHYHSNFHYLQYLHGDDVNHELIKISQILSIYPQSQVVKEQTKLFEDLNDSDTEKFWSKFFAIFEMKQAESDNSPDKSYLLQDAIQMLGNMAQFESYLNYKFPLIEPQRLKNLTVDSEMDKWNEFLSSSSENMTQDIDNCLGPYNVKNVNINKLATHVQELKVKCSHFHLGNHGNALNYGSFFSDFNPVVQDVIKYKSNIENNDASLLEKIAEDKRRTDKQPCLQHMQQIKRCNHLLDKIKFQKKIIQKGLIK